MAYFRTNFRTRRRTIFIALSVLLTGALILSSCNHRSCADCSCGRQQHDRLLIDVSGFTDKNVKNSADLVKWAEQAYENGWGYVWGTYGCILDEKMLTAKTGQYPRSVGDYSEFISEHWLGARTTDCVGLIKGYAWYDAAGGSFCYQSNGMPDLGANGMFSAAEEKGSIDTMPETAGLAVWKDGHIGVYIGKGWVIEARGTQEGVIKTRLKDVGWTHWLKVPYIEYDE